MNKGNRTVSKQFDGHETFQKKVIRRNDYLFV